MLRALSTETEKDRQTRTQQESDSTRQHATSPLCVLCQLFLPLYKEISQTHAQIQEDSFRHQSIHTYMLGPLQ